MNKKRHGLRNHPTYNSWRTMRQRCYNPNSTGYEHYGGRGITICKEWNNFQTFYKLAITNGWKKGLTIERIKVNKNYTPSNCTWATRREQSKNKTNSLIISAFGETKNYSDWLVDSRCLVPAMTLLHRIKHGWLPEVALVSTAQNKYSQADIIFINKYYLYMSDKEMASILNKTENAIRTFRFRHKLTKITNSKTKRKKT
jgi:hypothetical protein